MIRLMIKHYTVYQMYALRNALVTAYNEAIQMASLTGMQTVTKDIANTLSWLEDEITKQEAK